MGRRHVVTAITMLVLLGIVVLAAWIGLKSVFAPFGDPEPSADPTPTCAVTTVEKGKKLTSDLVVVSVYNAGTRPGLAGETQRLLAGRGFQKGDLGNAPPGVELRFVQVWTTEKHDDLARLVANQFGDDTLIKVKKKQDLGDGVDVLVGNDFRGLAKADKFVRARKTVDICTEVG